MSIVLADSTPLIYLAAISRFDLLGTLYGRIVIADAVYQEVVVQGAGLPGAVETDNSNWISRKTVSDPTKVTSLMQQLGPGESETIALAEELHADLVVMDDLPGRRALAAQQVQFVGTVGVLIQAKHRGMIPALKPELDRLRACGFHLTDRVYLACLSAAGE